MLIKDLHGLKYPDEYVIRFFFKEKLHERNGRVLELGCGNGNNLNLFYQYGWDVVGVDSDSESIDHAENNFSKHERRFKLSKQFQFIHEDMVSYCRKFTERPVDVLLVPSSIYYLERYRIIELLDAIKESGILTRDSLIFVRSRLPQDYRFGRGRRIGENSFILDIEETGEEGQINTFLFESELVGVLEKRFVFEYKRILYSSYDNLQMERIIANMDIIIWAKVKELVNP